MDTQEVLPWQQGWYFHKWFTLWGWDSYYRSEPNNWLSRETQQQPVSWSRFQAYQNHPNGAKLRSRGISHTRGWIWRQALPVCERVKTKLILDIVMKDQESEGLKRLHMHLQARIRIAIWIKGETIAIVRLFEHIRQSLLDSNSMPTTPELDHSECSEIDNYILCQETCINKSNSSCTSCFPLCQVCIYSGGGSGGFCWTPLFYPKGAGLNVKGMENRQRDRGVS